MMIATTDSFRKGNELTKIDTDSPSAEDSQVTSSGDETPEEKDEMQMVEPNLEQDSFAKNSVENTVDGDHKSWEAARRTYCAVKAENDGFHAKCTPQFVEHRDSRPELPEIDWKTLGFHFGPTKQEKWDFALNGDLDKRWTDFLAAEGKLWWARDPEQEKTEFRAALDKIEEFRHLCEQHEEKFDVQLYHEHVCWLATQEDQAWNSTITTPASDLSALQWKLNELFGPRFRDLDGYSENWSPDLTDAILSDIERLNSTKH